MIINDLRAMTDSAQSALSSASETHFECPFKDRSVWDAHWSRRGTFHIRMFKKPEQLQQILQYFADAKALQKQGISPNKSYRFPIYHLARYFGVLEDTLTKNVTSSKLYRAFLSAQETASPTVQQPNGGMPPMPCLPEIRIVGNDCAADVQHPADYFPELGPQDAAAVAWSRTRSPIASDATDDVSSQSGVVADAVPDEKLVLPEQLILELEDGRQPLDMSMIHRSKRSRAVDADELVLAGSLVLGDFPERNNVDDRAAARIALREQGHYFVDGRRLAEKAANSDELKKVLPRDWYPLFFPYLCVDSSELDSRLEQFETELSGEDDVETDAAEVQRQQESAGHGEEPPEAASEERRRSRRLAPKLVDTPSPQKKQKTCSGAVQTKVATAAGFLICVYTYLASIPVVNDGDVNASTCFQRIFQKFKRSGNHDRATDGGDNSRSQLKASNFPVPEKQTGETDESFFTRVAGYAVLLVYLHFSFTCFAMDLDPHDYPFDRHWDKGRSSALRSEAPSTQQGDHMDLDPSKSPAGVSAACNISKWAYRFSVLKNSAMNIRHHNGLCTDSAHYNRFKKALEQTHSLTQPEMKLLAVMMPGQTIRRKIRVAWQCYCALLAQADNGYKKMRLVQPELQPFMWIVFDTRTVHGGGPYPPIVPRRLRLPKGWMRWIYRYGKLHFRYRITDYWSSHISRRCLTSTPV